MPREVETVAKPLHWWVRRVCLAFASIIALIVFADHVFSLIIWLWVLLDHGRWKLSCETKPLLLFGVFTTVVVVRYFFSNDASKAAERAAAVSQGHHAIGIEETTPHALQEMSSVKRGKMPADEWREDTPNEEGLLSCYNDDGRLKDNSFRKKVERWLSGLESPSEGSILQSGIRAETAMANDCPQAMPCSSAKSPISAEERALQGKYVAQETKWAEDVPAGPDALATSPSSTKVTLCEGDQILPNDHAMQVTKHAESVSRDHSATVVDHCSQAKSYSLVGAPTSEEGQASLGDKTVQPPKRAEDVSTSPTALVMSPSSVKSTSPKGSQIPPGNKAIEEMKQRDDVSADHGVMAVLDSAVQSVKSKKGQNPSENKTAQVTNHARNVTTIFCLQRKPSISIVSAKLDEQAKIHRPQALGHCVGPSAKQDRHSLPAKTRVDLKDLQTPDQNFKDTSSLAQSTPCPAPRPRVMHKPVTNNSHSHNRNSDHRSSVLPVRQVETSPAQSSVTTLMAEETMSPESLRERRKFYKDLLYKENCTWPFALTDRQFKDLVYYDDIDDQPLQDISAIKNEQPMLEDWARTKAWTYLSPFHLSGVPETYDIERLKCWLSVRNHRRGEDPRPYPPGYKPVSQDRISLHNPSAVPVSPLLA